MSLYHIIRGFVVFWARLTGCSMVGKEQIPAEGPAILICNHTSMMDPIFLACVTKRQIYFMAKEEFFEKKFLGSLIRKVGGFPVSRGESDMASLRTAISHLKAGHLVGIFPEGTRNKGGGAMLPFKKGVALIAYKGQVPVIPLGMKRSRNFLAFWSRPRPSFAVGEPLFLPKEKTSDLLDTATGEFRGAMTGLLAKME